MNNNAIFIDAVDLILFISGRLFVAALLWTAGWASGYHLTVGTCLVLSALQAYIQLNVMMAAQAEK